MLEALIKFFKIFLWIFGIAILILLGTFYWYTRDLPNYEQILNYKPDSTINIFSEDGILLSSFFRENRIIINNDNIPQLLKDAVIAAEDRSFYSNPGIDFIGIIRALWITTSSYLTGKNKLVGGSTITQQIIKNILLSREKTLKRKLQEVKLAFGLTKYLTKDQILERYINHIYLGNNSYGFAQASVSYFSKSLDELTIEEAALLASLPQAPSRLDPIKSDNQDRLFTRRNWVISQMEKEGFISIKEANKSIKKPILLNPKFQFTQKALGIEFAIDTIKDDVLSFFCNNEEAMYTSGFNVYSTINSNIQKTTLFALRKGLLDFEKSRYPWNGPIDYFTKKEDYFDFLQHANRSEIYPLKFALVTTKYENRIGILLEKNFPEILISESNNKILKNLRIGDVIGVYETNLDFLEDTITSSMDDEEKMKILNKKHFQIYQLPRVNGAIVVMNSDNGKILSMAGGFNFYKNQFNRATQALRQPGSAFKPLIYLTGLENGFRSDSILLDEPIEFRQKDSDDSWKPKNYGDSYLGPITMETALIKSRNLATLYLAQEIGLGPIIINSKKFGLIPKNLKTKNYSMILGSQETTLLDMIRFYGIIGNGGFDIKPTLVDYMQNSSGKTVWSSTKETCDCNKITESKLVSSIPPTIEESEKTRLIKSEYDYELLRMMESTIQRGTGKGLAYLGENIAGKTGTSNNSKDVWFIGMTKHLAFGIYIGFDKPKSLGARATGGNTAIPIMKILLEKMKNNGELNLDEPFYSDTELREKIDNNNSNQIFEVTNDED